MGLPQSIVLMIPEDGQPTGAPVGSNEETDPYTACIRETQTAYLTTAETSGLTRSDNPTETLTALGPTNAAFDALPPGLLSTLLTAPFFPASHRYFAVPCFG
jgi:hypothetical protein